MWYIRQPHTACHLPDELLARGIMVGILEGGSMLIQQTADRHSVQLFGQGHIRAYSGKDSRVPAQTLGRKSSKCRRATQAEAAGYHVFGHVTDNEKINRAEIAHLGVILAQAGRVGQRWLLLSTPLHRCNRLLFDIPQTLCEGDMVVLGIDQVKNSWIELLDILPPLMLQLFRRRELAFSSNMPKNRIDIWRRMSKGAPITTHLCGYLPGSCLLLGDDCHFASVSFSFTHGSYVRRVAQGYVNDAPFCRWHRFHPHGATGAARLLCHA